LAQDISKMTADIGFDLTSIKSVLSSIMALWGSQLAAAGAAFFTQLLLARGLSVEDYGALATALAAVTLLLPLAGFGINQYWLRVFGVEGKSGQRWIDSTIRIALTSSIFVVITNLIWSWVGVFSKRVSILITILIVTILSQTVKDLAGSVFQLEGRYFALAFSRFLHHGLRLLASILVVLLGWSVFGTAIAYASAAIIIILVYAGPLFRMLSGGIKLQGHEISQVQRLAPDSKPAVLDTLRESWPFALSGLFYFIYFQSSIALLGMLAGEKPAGIYNVAFSVLNMIYLFPAAVYQQYLMPHLHRWAEHDQERFLGVYRLGGRIMLIVSIVFMGGVAGSAQYVVPWLFGDAYQDSGTVLVLLCLCIPLRFLATGVGSVLTTGGNMSRKVLYQGITAGISVTLNLILINQWGAMGAAVATVCTELSLLVLYILGAMFHTFGKMAISVIGPFPVWTSVLAWMVVVAILLVKSDSLLFAILIAIGTLSTSGLLAWRYLWQQQQHHGKVHRV